MATKASFKVALFMRPFYPSDIHIMSGDNNTLILHAKHDDHIDQHGIVKRELIREYQLPKGLSINRLKAEFTRNGIMIIQAEKDAQQVVSAESSELKVKTSDKKEVTEKIESARSPKTILEIEIRESAQISDLILDQELIELRQVAEFNLSEMPSSDEATEVKEKSETLPSLQLGLFEGMEIVEDREVAPSPQSSSTEISETAHSSSTEIASDLMEGSQSPKMMEVAAIPQSSSTEISEIAHSSSTEIASDRMEGSHSPKIIEAAEITLSPRATSMETTDTERSPQSSSTELTEETETMDIISGE